MILGDQQDLLVSLKGIKDNTITLRISLSGTCLVFVISRTIQKYYKNFVTLKGFWTWHHQNLSSIYMNKG